jgi:signal transduction histidine kinase
MLVSGLTLFFSVRAALLAGVEQSARDSALAAADTVDSGEALRQDDMERFRLRGGVVLVRDKDGRVLAQTVDLPGNAEERDSIWRRALRSDQPVGRTLQITEGASVYVYAVPVDPPRGPARVVEAGRSYEAAEEALETFSTVLVIGALASLLLSLSGAYLLARAALSPVGTVVAAARKITESDLSERLPVANPKDEIGNLTATINALLSRLEEAFARREEALLRLEETLGKQRRFVADASHELRTPLTNVEGYAEMLEEWALKDPETARESVEAIREESRRMRHLAEELLALARGDEGAPLELKSQDFGAVAQEATRIARDAAGGKVSVEHVPLEHKIIAVFDRSRVRQALSILLDNAVKYTPEGGEVRVWAHESDGQVGVTVRDTGVGIPDEELPRIFERFYRTDEARTRGGAGLGLAIARQIAEAHGGTMEVRSTLGKGSTFILQIPQNGPNH